MTSLVRGSVLMLVLIAGSGQVQGASDAPSTQGPSVSSAALGLSVSDAVQLGRGITRVRDRFHQRGTRVVSTPQYAVGASPAVGPDLGTDKPVLVQASAGNEPDVASDGKNFLAVFEDSQRIRAVRTNAKGRVLDREWIDLGEDGNWQFSPAVAFGGGHYLVAWWQDDGANVRIKGRVVNPDGSLVGTGSFTISGQTGFDVTLAWNGSAFLASWTGYDDISAIRVALVDASGAVVAGSEHPVSGNGSVSHPSIAVGSTTAVVAWEDGSATTDYTNRMKAARLGLDGAVLDEGGFRLSANESNEDQPSVASNGHRFLVTWHRSGMPGSIEGAVVSDSAGLVVPDFPISRSTGEASWPCVAFDGAAFVVAWKDERAVPAMEAALVSSTGVVAGNADTIASNVPASPPGYYDNTGLAWNGSRFLLVFKGDRPSSSGDVFGIEGSLIRSDLTLTPGPLGLSLLRAGELAPSVVWDGRNYLVSWMDERAGGYDQATSRAVRINKTGHILDRNGIALSDGQPAVGQVASNADRQALVTLVPPSSTPTYRFVGADGDLGATQSLADRVLSGAAVAGNGVGYLALLTTMHPDYSFDLSARLIGADGTLGAEIPIDASSNGTGDVVAAGDGYLVASWTGGGQLTPVSATGAVGAPMSLSLASTSLSSATNGRKTLVAWTPGFGDLPFAADARFMANGTFYGPTLELAPTTAGYSTALAWDGHSYWAVWAAVPEGSSVVKPFIRSIAPNGTLGPVAQVFDGECDGPALASNGRRQLLLSCYAFTDQYRVVTVSTRLIDTSAALPSLANP